MHLCVLEQPLRCFLYSPTFQKPKGFGCLVPGRCSFTAFSVCILSYVTLFHSSQLKKFFCISWNCFIRLSRNSSQFWRTPNLSFSCRVGLTPAWRCRCPARRSWHATWFQSPLQNFAITHFKDISGRHVLFIQSLINFSFPDTSLTVAGNTSHRVTPDFNRQHLRCPATQGRSLCSGTFYCLQTLHVEYAQSDRIRRGFEVNTEVYAAKEATRLSISTRSTPRTDAQTAPAGQQTSVRWPRVYPVGPYNRTPVVPNTCPPTADFR